MAESGKEWHGYKPLEAATPNRGFLETHNSSYPGRLLLRSVPSRNPAESLMVRLMDKPAAVDVQNRINWWQSSVMTMGLNLDAQGGLTGFRNLAGAVPEDPQIFLGYWGIKDPSGRKPAFAVGYRFDAESGLGYLAQGGVFESPDLIPDLSRNMPKFKKAPFASLAADPERRRLILEMTGLPEVVDPVRTLKWLVEGRVEEQDGSLLILTAETFTRTPLLPPLAAKTQTP